MAWDGLLPKHDRTWHLTAREAAILRQALHVQALRVSDLFPLMTDTLSADIKQSVADLMADGLLILLEDEYQGQ